MYPILFLAITSFAVCLILTPLVRSWFRWYGVLDHPNEARKVHPAPLPKAGGVAIAISYLAALTLLLTLPTREVGGDNLGFIGQLIPAAGVIFATGLLDDLIGLRPWEKLFGQTAAASLAYWAGVRILGIAGFSTDGWWSVPLTILWLVGCANAFNLIDGVDGLATGVGLFATLTMFLAALLDHNTALAIATVPLAGALLGFLRYNFNPASIFLGDCGSLSIGFLLGCFGVIWGQKSATLLGMTAPLMALSIPLLDTALSILRRFLRHQPIFGADRNHIHHRLLDRGLSPRRVSLLLYGMCGVAAAFSLLQSRLQHKFGELIIVVFCTAAWIGILHLRYGEFGALRRLLFTGTFRDLLDTQLYMTKFEKKLAVAKTEDECWQAVQDVGKDFGFTRVRMQLGGRAYEAQLSEAKPVECWTMSIPLSDAEFVDLVHRRESSVRTMIATTSLADILERSLRPRIQQTQTISDVSRDGDQLLSDGRLSKQPLAASGPAVESSLAAGA